MTPPLPTDTRQTAPAPASGDVVVPRKVLEQIRVGLAGLSRHYKTCAIFQPSAGALFPKCDCGIGELNSLLDTALASTPRPSALPPDNATILSAHMQKHSLDAPRPSGDVAAKLAERLRHAASYMYDIHSQGGGWQTGKDVRPALLCDAADTLLSLSERIATLEQELAGAHEMVGRKSEQYIAARKHADQLEQERTARDAECARLGKLIAGIVVAKDNLGKIALQTAIRDAAAVIFPKRRALGDQ